MRRLLPLVALCLVLNAEASPDPRGYVDARWGTPVKELWLLYPEAHEEDGDLFVQRMVVSRQATIRLGLVSGKLAEVLVSFTRAYLDDAAFRAEIDRVSGLLRSRYGPPQATSPEEAWTARGTIELSWTWPTTTVALVAGKVDGKGRIRVRYSANPQKR